ncbi:hypothetical protein NPIL_420811 [Nephila pilipes]|uniref:Uncharacterized protein n=1 Tax=Nephila pilipes TaxID=299642 RepID=A0A8X6QJ61_NEPPI|nr:hypothetical protein NPIL_420811 [Nephila pilipes]
MSLVSHKVHQKSQELWIKSSLSTRASRGRYGHIGIKSRSVYNWTVPFLHYEMFFCRVGIVQQERLFMPINANCGCPVIPLDGKMLVSPTRNLK